MALTLDSKVDSKTDSPTAPMNLLGSSEKPIPDTPWRKKK